MSRFNHHIEIRMWLGTALLLGLLFTACEKPSQNDVAESPVDSRIQTVEVVKAQLRSFTADVQITGTAMPDQKVMLRAMESGYLKHMRKDIGDVVKRGAVIAVLENPNITQLVSDSQAGLQVGQADLMTVKAELQAVEADFKAKKARYSRLHDVYQKTPQLTPISEVEAAEGKAEVAQATVEMIKAKVTANERKIEALMKRVEIAKAREAMLNIRAPFDGVITQRLVDEGAMIQSGIDNSDAGAIVEIQDTDPIRLSLHVPESDAMATKKGMEVSVTFPELAGKSFSASVSRMANALDPTSKTMQVEVDIPNPNGLILTGMYARTTMRLNSRDSVLSLPLTAQIMYRDEPFVMIVTDGIVERVPLRKGLISKDYFEVLNTDITAETLVIVQGKGLVKPGQIVEPILKRE